MKQCCNCKIKLEITNFYKDNRASDGLQSRCKKCYKLFYKSRSTNYYRQYYKNYYNKNKESSIKKSKNYYFSNKEKCSKKAKEYNIKNAITIRAYKNNYNKIKRNNSVTFKLAYYMRTRIRSAIKGNWKSGSAVQDLGMPITLFKLYLASKWKPGMHWGNYGKQWHLDHIIPLCKFDLTDREQFLKAVNWKNIQPLWAHENLSKGGSYE